MKTAVGREPDDSKSQPGPKRLLLVEDSEDNRFMLRRLLEIGGYQVVEAVNGPDAVRIAEQGRPHLILMDLSLPIIDGLSATRKIRQMPKLANVPIIAVSAHDSADFHTQALEAGCDGYITKPIDFTQLEELITRLLANSKP